jgi:hypothetical protein
MVDGHLVGRRGVALVLAVSMLGAAASCSEGGGSGGKADPQRAEQYKQRKLDSMKEIMKKNEGAKRSP